MQASASDGRSFVHVPGLPADPVREQLRRADDSAGGDSAEEQPVESIGARCPHAGGVDERLPHAAAAWPRTRSVRSPTPCAVTCKPATSRHYPSQTLQTAELLQSAEVELSGVAEYSIVKDPLRCRSSLARELGRLFCRSRSWGNPASSGDSYGSTSIHLSVWLCWAAPGGRGHERGSGMCEDRGARIEDRGLYSSLSRFRFPFSIHTGTFVPPGDRSPGSLRASSRVPWEQRKHLQCSRAFWVGQVGFWGLALAGGDWRILLVSGGFCARVFGWS